MRISKSEIFGGSLLPPKFLPKIPKGVLINSFFGDLGYCLYQNLTWVPRHQDPHPVNFGGIWWPVPEKLRSFFIKCTLFVFESTQYFTHKDLLAGDWFLHHVTIRIKRINFPKTLCYVARIKRIKRQNIMLRFRINRIKGTKHYVVLQNQENQGPKTGLATSTPSSNSLELRRFWTVTCLFELYFSPYKLWLREWYHGLNSYISGKINSQNQQTIWKLVNCRNSSYFYHSWGESNSTWYCFLCMHSYNSSAESRESTDSTTLSPENQQNQRSRLTLCGTLTTAGQIDITIWLNTYMYGTCVKPSNIAVDTTDYNR